MRQCFIPYPGITGQSWTALLTVQNFAKAPRLTEATSLITLITCNKLPSQDVWHRGGQPDMQSKLLQAKDSPPRCCIPSPWPDWRAALLMPLRPKKPSLTPGVCTAFLSLGGITKWRQMDGFSQAGRGPRCVRQQYTALLSSPPPLGAQCWNAILLYLKGSPEMND